MTPRPRRAGEPAYRCRVRGRPAAASRLAARAAPTASRASQAGFPDHARRGLALHERRRPSRATAFARQHRGAAPVSADARPLTSATPSSRRQLVFVNGRFAPDAVLAGAAGRRAQLRSLAERWSRCRARRAAAGHARAIAGHAVRGAQHRALRGRRRHRGGAAARSLAEPIHLVFMLDARRRGAPASAIRACSCRWRPAAARPRSSRRYGGAATASVYFTNAVTEIVLDDGAPSITTPRCSARATPRLPRGHPGRAPGPRRAASRRTRSRSGGALGARRRRDQPSPARAASATLDGLFVAGRRRSTSTPTPASTTRSRTARAASSTRASWTAARAASSTGRIVVRPGRAEDRRAPDEQEPAALARGAGQQHARSSRSWPTT